MARPLIGVCAAVERAAFGVWGDEPAVLLPLSYARAIHGAGGMMAMLPPDRRATEDPAELLERIDALVLGGGADIDPESQGAEAHPETIGHQSRPRPLRDRAGAGGGSSVGSRCSASAVGCRSSTSPAVGRSISTCPTGSATSATGRCPGHGPSMTCASSRVPCRRGRPGPSGSPSRAITIRGSITIPETLTASAWATDDESVEAIESTDGDFVLGVLWHPEEDPEDSVIRSLVSRATA